jgi:hypothetical protein
MGLTAPVEAQSTRPEDTTNLERLRQQDQSRRELQLRNLNIQAEPAKDTKRFDQVAAEIQQDFERILVLHNELAHFILDNKPLDYDVVSEATAEIKKRAAHLQKTLAFNKPDNESAEEKKPEFRDARLKHGVATLCAQIKSFVTNPVIENPGVVNAPELARARRDLQNVIDLSGELKKSADRLKKTP